MGVSPPFPSLLLSPFPSFAFPHFPFLRSRVTPFPFPPLLFPFDDFPENQINEGCLLLSVFGGAHQGMG